MGGVRTGADALAFLAAGASAVSVGTAVFGDPGAPMRILPSSSRAELQARGVSAVADVIGSRSSAGWHPVTGCARTEPGELDDEQP